MSAAGEKRELRRRLGLAMGELEELQLSLGHSYHAFNSTSDPEILEACILEIAALRRRYSALLRSIKSMEGDKIKWQSQ